MTNDRSGAKLWWAKHRLTVIGLVFLVVGLSVTAALAFQATTEDPPDGFTSILYVVVAALFQAFSVFCFNRSGRADPSMALVAVEHLVTLGRQTNSARLLAEQAVVGTPTEAKKAVGDLSVHLSYIEDGVVASANHWAAFHPSARERLQEDNA